MVPALAAVWSLLPNRVPSGTPTTGNGELNFLRMDVKVAKKKTANLVPKLTETEQDLLSHIQDGYQLETDSLGGNLILSLPPNSVAPFLS